MKKYISFTLHFTLVLFFSVSISVWTGCREVVPSAATIEKAQIETRSILDSLSKNGNTIIGDVKLVSQGFDGDIGKYLINYKIESGLDSSHIMFADATVFIERVDDNWIYRFVFGETYERELD
jgi:hypothetical protein